MGLSPRPIGRVARLVPLAVAVGLAGCGGGGDAGGGYGGARGETVASGAETVAIEDFLYAPDDLTVDAGTTISFPNEDASPHTVTSREPGDFDSGTIKPGKTGELTLEQPGTFAYYCAFHPFMKGSVTVE